MIQKILHSISTSNAFCAAILDCLRSIYVYYEFVLCGIYVCLISQNSILEGEKNGVRLFLNDVPNHRRARVHDTSSVNGECLNELTPCMWIDSYYPHALNLLAHQNHLLEGTPSHLVKSFVRSRPVCWLCLRRRIDTVICNANSAQEIETQYISKATKDALGSALKSSFFPNGFYLGTTSPHATD